MHASMHPSEAMGRCCKVPVGGAGSPPLGAGRSHAGMGLLGAESGCVHIMGLECPSRLRVVFSENTARRVSHMYV